MNQKQLARIEARAQEFLECCRKVEHPFKRLAELVERLKVDPAWAEHEIIELQTRVIRSLLDPLKQADNGKPR